MNDDYSWPDALFDLLLFVLGVFLFLCMAPGTCHGQQPGGVYARRPDGSLVPIDPSLLQGWQPAGSMPPGLDACTLGPNGQVTCPPTCRPAGPPVCPPVATPAPAPPSTGTPPRPRPVAAQGPYAAVCRIILKFGQASGVLVCYRDRVILLTAAHVVEGNVKAQAYSATESYQCTVQAVDTVADIAALSVNNVTPNTPTVTLAPGDVDNVYGPGDRFQVLGYTEGVLAMVQSTFLGYVGGKEVVGNDWLAVTGAVRPGDSGGPILDRQGRVAGVLWGSDGNRIIGAWAGRIHRLLEDNWGRFRYNAMACPPGNLQPRPEIPVYDDPPTFKPEPEPWEEPPNELDLPLPDLPPSIELPLPEVPEGVVGPSPPITPPGQPLVVVVDCGKCTEGTAVQVQQLQQTVNELGAKVNTLTPVSPPSVTVQAPQGPTVEEIVAEVLRKLPKPVPTNAVVPKVEEPKKYFYRWKRRDP